MQQIMLRILSVLVLGGILMMWPFQSRADETLPTAYDFTFHKLTGGGDLPLAQFKGKVILVVNTASQCGFTGQYEGLEKLYKDNAERGFVIVGVPSNDFGEQEPGSDDEIAGFCQMNYGVTFPMASKEAVTGDTAHPFYKWARDMVGFLGSPKWNFHKYLINRQGELVDYFHSTTKPDDDRLVKEINDLLDEKSASVSVDQ